MQGQQSAFQTGVPIQTFPLGLQCVKIIGIEQLHIGQSLLSHLFPKAGHQLHVIVYQLVVMCHQNGELLRQQVIEAVIGECFCIILNVVAKMIIQHQ